jgi:hypothetical protein
MPHQPKAVHVVGNTKRHSNKMKVTSFILFPFLFASSCNTNQSVDKKQNSLLPITKPSDTIIETDLSRATEYYKSFYISKNWPMGQEKIDSLVSSYDSLQIRLWELGGLYPNSKLYIITKKNSIWNGFYYEMEAENKYATGDSSVKYLKGPIPLEVKNVKRIFPKSGWVKFIDSLLTLNIITLPDMDEIAGMKIPWTDANGTIVEVATKDNFRFYSYSEPLHFADSFWQARKMANIQSLFYTAFQK